MKRDFSYFNVSLFPVCCAHDKTYETSGLLLLLLQYVLLGHEDLVSALAHSTD